MTNIINSLKQFGLKEKEIKIYLALIQSSPSTVQNISRLTSIPRATVYQRLENLKKIGLIDFVIDSTGKLIKAIHPKYLISLAQKRVEKSIKLKDNIMNVMPDLLSIYQPIESKAKVMHFEGIQAVRRMIMNYDMEAKDKNLYGYATYEMTEILGKNFIYEQYHKKFFKKGYIDHFIMSDCKENKKYFNWVKNYKLYKKGRIIVKKLPEKLFNLRVNVAIYDDKYSISLMKGGKVFGVLIQNKEIHDHQMELFMFLWNKAIRI